MTTKPTRELTGDEASRYLKERTMFPTAEQFESMGVRPRLGLPSMLDRMRDTQRRLKDSNSIEDFVREHDDGTIKSATHAIIGREAHRLYKSVAAYKTQHRVSDYLREMQEAEQRVDSNRVFSRDMIELAELLSASRGGWPVGDLTLLTAATRSSGRPIDMPEDGLNSVLRREDLVKVSARITRPPSMPIWWALNNPDIENRLVRFEMPKQRPQQDHKYELSFDFEASLSRMMYSEPGPTELSDKPIVMEGLDWSPGVHLQSIGRLKRRALVNVIERPKTSPQASRNVREGRYNFKANGRHTRLYIKPKPVVKTLSLDAEVLEKLTRKGNPAGPISTPGML